MKTKIKVYKLCISEYFPKTHKRAGEPTFFAYKIGRALKGKEHFHESANELSDPFFKLHTLRVNYELWQKRIAEVKAGKAILVMFEWKGKPYHSRQHDLFIFSMQNELYRENPDLWNFIADYTILNHDDCLQISAKNLSVQKLLISKEPTGLLGTLLDENNYTERHIAPDKIANNDGLSFDDFKDWFKKHDCSNLISIIHWTDFKY
jgi:hypothetical protein